MFYNTVDLRYYVNKCVFLLSNEMSDSINQFTSLPVKNIILLHSANASFFCYNRAEGVFYPYTCWQECSFWNIKTWSPGNARDYGVNPLEFNPRRLPRSKDSSQMKFILRSRRFLSFLKAIVWYYYRLAQCATFF